MKSFNKEDLLEMHWSNGDLRIIETKVTGQSRWLTHKRTVFQDADGRYYETVYSVGSTESQDYTPYQDDPEFIDCKEVFLKEKVITVYE